MTSTKALLQAHALRPKKSFGQNFLTDASIASRIAQLATTPTGGTVVEIGAGLGALTVCLLARAERVIAIERDRDLIPLLRDCLEHTSARAQIVEADAKTVDLAVLFRNQPRPHVLTGNLPYHLTGPLLEKTIRAHGLVHHAIFLVQLEVAQRLAARAGSKTYGALSVFTQAAFEVERVFIVRRGAFYPQPGVDSAVVRLTARTRPIASETPLFRAVVHAAFAQRRKTLRNAWRGLLEFPETHIARAAEAADIRLTDRGETLDVHAFSRMAQELER